MATVAVKTTNYWKAYLVTRALTIKWLSKQVKCSDLDISKIMSLSELEVKLIRTTPIDE